MDKNKQEAAEIEMYKYLINKNPKFKEIIDNMIQSDNVELKDIITPVIENKLKEARIIGINIGFQGAMLSVYEAVKNMDSPDEIKEYLKSRVDSVRNKLGLKSAFDDIEDENKEL